MVASKPLKIPDGRFKTIEIFNGLLKTIELANGLRRSMKLTVFIGMKLTCGHNYFCCKV